LKNKKTIAIILTLIFIALPLSEITAANSQNEENDKINIEYSILTMDGTQINKDTAINKEELNVFNEIISKIFDAITQKNENDINKILEDLKTEYGQNGLFSIISTIAGLRPLQKRVFIISNGYGTKFDLHLRSDFSLRKRFAIWHYIPDTDLTKSSTTVIIDPIPNVSLKFIKVLSGWQIGIMSKFTGIYIRIPGKIQEQIQSQTFFFGYAVKVLPLNLPDA
jgi:hypothetical protein